MDQRALQDAINNAVTAELEKFHCVGGILHCEIRQGSDLVSLRGNKSDGKVILLWPDLQVLHSLVGRYFDAIPNVAGFTLDIDLHAQTYRYKTIAPAELRTRDAKEAKERDAAAAREKLEARHALQARSTPFGLQLAEEVARKLRTHGLYDTHRDYCGMGLELRDGEYCYGEVYDGGLEPMLRFPDSETFVGWLSTQSDASLGRLEEKDSWYWGNQTLTRERLEHF